MVVLLPDDDPARALLEASVLPDEEELARAVPAGAREGEEPATLSFGPRAVRALPPSLDPFAVRAERSTYDVEPVARAPHPPPPVRAETPAPGVLFAHRYDLEEQLGQGGTSVVLKARDRETHDVVAVKILALSRALPGIVERFHREIEVVRQLDHPGIVRILDSGTTGDHEYLVMELLVGRDLRQLIGRPLPVVDAVRYVLHASAALEHAHARGIVHRDVKPANMFITRAGGVKLMDFGLAKQRGAGCQSIVGTLIGTPEYMAPEQISGRDAVGPATDVYSLGITMYELLTGQLPFQHPDLVRLLHMQAEEEPVPIEKLRPDVPPALAEVVRAMTRKRVGDRLQDFSRVRRALSAAWGFGHASRG